MAKVIRAVVEVAVPDSVTEKRLVWKLRQVLRYPMQLGITGDTATLVKAEVKSFGRFMPHERKKAAGEYEDPIESEKES